jgi:FMN-dependent NADH-azoreductase
MKLLHIDASILAGGSVSRDLSALIVERLTEGAQV